MSKRLTKKMVTFEGVCRGCDGTGLWNGREGYPHFECNGTGKVTVALVEGENGVTFYGVTAKGTITKWQYEAAAELTADFDRYESRWLNSGRYTRFDRTDRAGTACGVYGTVVDDGGVTRFMVALPGGGYATTGQSNEYSAREVGREAQTVEARVTEQAALDALAELARRKAAA